MAREYEKREFCNDMCILGKIFTKHFISSQICKPRCIFSLYEFCNWLQENGFQIIQVIENNVRVYKKQELCKEICTVQHLIDQYEADWLKKKICHTRCLVTAWGFHDYLQKMGLKIVKNEE